MFDQFVPKRWVWDIRMRHTFHHPGNGKRRFLARDNQSDKNGDRSGDTWLLGGVAAVPRSRFFFWGVMLKPNTYKQTPANLWFRAFKGLPDRPWLAVLGVNRL